MKKKIVTSVICLAVILVFNFALPRLMPGDTVLMVSDGICGTGDDRWLREKLEGFDGASPKDLARELITQSPQGATDDRTALVIRLEKRRVFDH